jgi:hypothetical protein
MTRSGILVASLAAVLWIAYPSAQARTFGTRLSVVPLTIAMQQTVAGQGSVTAVLAGNRLTVEGKFDGLRSPATTARLHVAPRAMHGEAIAELTVTKDTSGTLKGSVELNDRQREALQKLSLYVQVNSEKAPEGNLWGWLIPQEVKR